MKHDIVFHVNKDDKLSGIMVRGDFSEFHVSHEFSDYIVKMYASKGFKCTIDGVVFAELDLFPDKVVAIGNADYLELKHVGNVDLAVFNYDEIIEFYDFTKSKNFR